MREALTQAATRNIKRFTMESDSKQLINLVKTDQFHLNIYRVLQDIAKIAIDLNVFFMFIPKSNNEEGQNQF